MGSCTRAEKVQYIRPKSCQFTVPDFYYTDGDYGLPMWSLMDNGLLEASTFTEHALILGCYMWSRPEEDETIYVRRRFPFSIAKMTARIRKMVMV